MNNEIKKSYKIVRINKFKISYILKPRLKIGPKISLIFLPGYNSDMFGTKAVFLDNLRKKIGFEYLRFNYSGHGSSEGQIKKQCISSWIAETKYFIKNKLKYPTIVVGSSLGGWISLVVSQKPNKKIKGIIGIGTAPDFTENILKSLSLQEKEKYKKNKFLSFSSKYTKEKFIFTKNFIDDSKKYLILKKKINTESIVSLLYGSKDAAVSLDNQLKILELLNAKSSKLIIVKNSDHRMSSKKDLILLKRTIKNMIKDIL